MKKIETYKEPRWLKLRASVLRRDNYTDQYLKRYGKMKQAEVVHHIFPVVDFPQYQYEAWNLISVTKSTHQSFHERDTDRLSKKGIELLIYTCNKHNVPIPEWYIQPPKRNRKRFYDYTY